MTARTVFKCPDCGRFSRGQWEVASGENSAIFGAECHEHGEWRDST